MRPETLEILEQLIQLTEAVRRELTGLTEQYERDRLRDAANELRSVRSALAPKIAAFQAARQRDKR